MTIVSTDLRYTKESARRTRFDPVLPFTATNVQDAIQQVQAFVTISQTVVTVAMSPYTPLLTDRILLVNTSAGAVTINMPPAATRTGLDIEIKDDTGNAGANPITVNGNGAETLDGFAAYPIDAPFAAVKFLPKVAGNWDVI
jgi:hypothetical protein